MPKRDFVLSIFSKETNRKRLEVKFQIAGAERLLKSSVAVRILNEKLSVSHLKGLA